MLNTDEGLIVKRLGKDGRRWHFVSDHPSWKPAPWPREAKVIGEVRWHPGRSGNTPTRRGMEVGRRASVSDERLLSENLDLARMRK